jgi:hypothetical protein
VRLDFSARTGTMVIFSGLVHGAGAVGHAGTTMLMHAPSTPAMFNNWGQIGELLACRA